MDARDSLRSRIVRAWLQFAFRAKTPADASRQ